MPTFRKTSTTMFDGRELIYFDDADTTLESERGRDLRPVEPRSSTASMRQDPLTGEWISIAASRQNRVFLPPAHLDPLAPTSDANPSEIPGNYDVVVFENKSPSFGPDLSPDLAPDLAQEPGSDAHSSAEIADLRRIGLGRTKTSVGRCEVISFSPDSSGSFAMLSHSRARTIMEAWADRTRELSKLPGIEQVFPFENRGQDIGVTLHHPHGQIYAYPFITPRTQKLLDSIASYGSSLMADILRFEQESDRVIHRGTHFTAFVPFAARWPLEIHVLPERHVPDFAELTTPEKEELVTLFQALLGAVDRLYETPTPYIAAWHQAPVSVGRDTVRMMLQITSPRRAADKLKYLAGSEAAMGAFIGDIQPETSAELLRSVFQIGEE